MTDHSAPLAHIVFFTLQDRSPASRDRLAASCNQYLSGHDGVLHFGVGVRGEEFVRDSNDQAYDVALHLVFASKQDHDRYQEAPRHLQFVEENQASWANVRVFDSYLT